MNPVAIAIGILTLIALALLAWMRRIIASRRLRGGAKTAIESAWRHAQSQTSSTLRVIEADKTLDEALRLLGYTGTLGEKLIRSKGIFSDTNGVWWAHKHRNKLVHELSAPTSEEHAVTAMKAFRQALCDLGASV